MADDGQLFCLKWNGFGNSITSVFADLRQDEELVDITLCCEGKKVKAHRMMLSASSPYFRDLLKENPCQHPVFFLMDTSYADLRAIIEFVYNGEVNVTQAQLSSFLKTAEMLQVRGLTGEVDKDSVSAPPSPRTQQRPAPPRPVPSTPSPVSRPPATPIRRPMVPAAPPPPVNSEATAGRTASPPSESPPASPSTKRRRLGSGSRSSDGLEAAAAAVASSAAASLSATTDPASFGLAQSTTVKVEKTNLNIANDDEQHLHAASHKPQACLPEVALGHEVDYEGSYDLNQSLAAISVLDTSQGEATAALQEDDPLWVPFSHGWRREIVLRNESSGKQKYDCYYFTPTDKRLRSLCQVQAFRESY